MSLVIVTDKCYLTCEAINYINIQEYVGSNGLFDAKKSKKPVPDKDKIYEITIDFSPNPITSKNNINPDIYTEQLKFKIRGKTEAERAFKLVVNQIRDQIPDKFHINSLIEDFLTL